MPALRAGRSDIFAHGGARHDAETMGVPFLGEIPAGDGHPRKIPTPAGRSSPWTRRARIAAAYVGIAAKVQALLERDEKKKKG